MNQSTTNLEMPTVRDVCSRMSTNNNCLSFVTIKFELVGTHPSPDMLDTLLCLFDKDTKISRRGRTGKLCII